MVSTISSELRGLDAFGLCWLHLGDNHDDGDRNTAVLLLPGTSNVGGSESIEYGILIAKINDGRALQEHKYFQTDILTTKMNVGKSICSGIVLVSP
jgi:hypothetical protein